MPIAAVAATVATLAEKLARPPPSSTWSAAKAGDLAGRAIDADARAHLEGVAFDAALKLLIAIMRQPDRLAGKEHRRQRDVEHERRVVASAEAAADIGELGVDARGLERRARPCRAGTRSTRRPRRATARRARVRAFAPFLLYQARPHSGSRNIGSTDWVSNSRSSTSRPDFSRPVRRGSARRRSRPWRRGAGSPWRAATRPAAPCSGCVPG